MGIVGIEAASSAQLKGVEEIVAGIRGSGIGIGKGIESEMVGGSVCVDTVTEVDWGVKGGFI